MFRDNESVQQEGEQPHLQEVLLPNDLMIEALHHLGRLMKRDASLERQRNNPTEGSPIHFGSVNAASSIDNMDKSQQLELQQQQQEQLQQQQQYRSTVSQLSSSSKQLGTAQKYMTATTNHSASNNNQESPFVSQYESSVKKKQNRIDYQDLSTISPDLSKMQLSYDSASIAGAGSQHQLKFHPLISTNSQKIMSKKVSGGDYQPIHKRWTTLVEARSAKRAEVKEKQDEAKRREEDKNLTFQPQIQRNDKSQTARTNSQLVDSFNEWNKVKQQKISTQQWHESQREVADLTFKPKINATSEKILQAKAAVTDDLEENLVDQKCLTDQQGVNGSDVVNRLYKQKELAQGRREKKHAEELREKYTFQPQINQRKKVANQQMPLEKGMVRGSYRSPSVSLKREQGLENMASDLKEERKTIQQVYGEQLIAQQNQYEVQQYDSPINNYNRYEGQDHLHQELDEGDEQELKEQSFEQENQFREQDQVQIRIDQTDDYILRTPENTNISSKMVSPEQCTVAEFSSTYSPGQIAAAVAAVNAVVATVETDDTKKTEFVDVCLNCASPTKRFYSETNTSEIEYQKRMQSLLEILAQECIPKVK